MKQILIVEDDNLLNKTLVYNLASDGYNITSATNAKDATNKLQNQQYDMVLLDVNLPDGNGYDIFKISNIIQKNYPSYIMMIRCLN